MSNYKIWITFENENPDFEDFARSQGELENLGIDYEGKVGVGMTIDQWINFQRNASRFEMRFLQAIPNEPLTVMGFPVRIISPLSK